MFEKRTRIITYYVDGAFERPVNTLIDILERIDCSTVYNDTIDCEIYDYLLNKKYYYFIILCIKSRDSITSGDL